MSETKHLNKFVVKRKNLISYVQEKVEVNISSVNSLSQGCFFFFLINHHILKRARIKDSRSGILVSITRIFLVITITYNHKKNPSKVSEGSGTLKYIKD